jgi:hypothetical protein
MKTRTLVLTIVLAVGGLFLVLVVGAVGLFLVFYKNADAAVSPKIDSLFAAVDNGTFAGTYLTETTPELRAALSQEKYERIGRTVQSRLGHLRSKTLTQFNASWFNGESCMNVAYSAAFEKGTATIRASFKKLDGQWRLLGIFVESPQLLDDASTVKCPHCGETAPSTAKYCPSCGKSIADRKPTGPSATK